MVDVEVVLKNEVGLHARPSGMFVKLASKYKSEISLIKNDKKFMGKSMLQILSMGAMKGDEIRIVAEGEDEKEAINSLKELVESNFGE